ncbi:MAG: TAXI family TRAP transporter solute-binding subunit [Deltaproteobacteria bacterium]|nr:TAXI family TRAP transporter solute-binding subunit [Deltaproteobacteria bacterium]
MPEFFTFPKSVVLALWLTGLLFPQSSIAGLASSPHGSVQSLAAAKSPALPRELGIATHSVGTVYYTQGTAVAKVLTDFGQMKVLAKPMTGPNAWMPTFSRGEIEMGLVSAPDTNWAFHGVKEAGYPQRAQKIRLVQRGVPLWIGMIVRQDSPIRSISDLKGKRVASGHGGNFIINKNIEATLATVGLTPADTIPVPVASFVGGQEAFREGRVDSIFAGTPATAATVESAAAVGARFLPLPKGKEAVERCRRVIPACEFTVMKAGYGILKEDTVFMGYYNYLVGHADALSEAAAYQIARSLWQHHKELWRIHVTLKEWQPEAMADPDPGIPYHPGAMRFYKEAGVWTRDLERKQEQLLRESGK